jgi:hypothetical protein
MYGVPANLKLDFLHGAELVQLYLGLHQLQFRFHPEACISVEGNWELRGIDDEIIDRNHNTPDRSAYELHRLLGYRVLWSQVFAPTHFVL